MWKTIEILAQPTPFYLIPPFWNPLPTFIKKFSDPLSFLQNLEDLISLKKGGFHYAVIADYLTTCLRNH